MAGALRKTMLYLGLAEDTPNGEEFYPESPQQHPVPIAISAPQAVGNEMAEVTPIRRTQLTEVTAPRGEELRRITTIHPRSYNDARVIGEAFRAGTPVIMNLTDMDDSDAKRLVDFSAGLIFGLHGAIERVTNKVFLLSPEHVEIMGEEDVVPATSAGHFYNQS